MADWRDGRNFNESSWGGAGKHLLEWFIDLHDRQVAGSQGELCVINLVRRGDGWISVACFDDRGGNDDDDRNCQTADCEFAHCSLPR